MNAWYPRLGLIVLIVVLILVLTGHVHFGVN